MWALSAAETQSAGGARRQRRKLTGCLANKGEELIFNSKLWIPKIISRRDYLSPSRLFLICSINGNSFPIKMSYPNEFNLGGNCLKRLAGKKYATMALERSSCTGILWNVFRAEAGFPRSLPEICEQIYCHVLIHPGCYLSKCSLLACLRKKCKVHPFPNSFWNVWWPPVGR